MLKWTLTGILISFLIANISYAESGNQKVYDYSGSGGGAGTTTSNIYGYDGANWQKLKAIETIIGYLLGNAVYGSRVDTGAPSWIKVDADGYLVPKSPNASSFKTQAEITSPLTPDNSRIKTEEYSGYNVLNIRYATAQATATLISNLTGEKIRIKSVILANSNTSTGGLARVFFNSTNAGTVFEDYLDAKKDVGFDTCDLSATSEGLYYTGPANVFIKIIYTQGTNP